MKITSAMITLGTPTTPKRVFVYFSGEKVEKLTRADILAIEDDSITFLLTSRFNAGYLTIQKANYTKLIRPFSFTFAPSRIRREIATMVSKEEVEIIEQVGYDANSLTITLRLTPKLKAALVRETGKPSPRRKMDLKDTATGHYSEKQKTEFEEVARKQADNLVLTPKNSGNVRGFSNTETGPEIVLSLDNVNFILDLMKENGNLSQCKVPGTNVIITR